MGRFDLKPLVTGNYPVQSQNNFWWTQRQSVKNLKAKYVEKQLWSAEDEWITTVSASLKTISACMCINISISLYHNYNHLGTTKIAQQSCLMSYVWSSTLTLEDHGCWDTTFSMCFLCSFLESLSFKESLCQWSKPQTGWLLLNLKKEICLIRL